MSKIDKLKLKKLRHHLGLKYGLSDDKIEEITNSPYEFTANKIRELDLSSIKTEEEFNKLKTNFIYTSFFKLIIDYKSIKARNNRRNNINNINKEKWKNK